MEPTDTVGGDTYLESGGNPREFIGTSAVPANAYDDLILGRPYGGYVPPVEEGGRSYFTAYPRHGPTLESGGRSGAFGGRRNTRPTIEPTPPPTFFQQVETIAKNLGAPLASLVGAAVNPNPFSVAGAVGSAAGLVRDMILPPPSLVVPTGIAREDEFPDVKKSAPGRGTVARGAVARGPARGPARGSALGPPRDTVLGGQESGSRAARPSTAIRL